MGRTSFSPSDEKLLEVYADDGMSAADIARKLKKPYSSTHKKYMSFVQCRPDSEEDERRCLRCLKWFDSSSRGNRICPACTPLNAGYVGVVLD